MSSGTFRDLTKAVEEFSRLTGRKLNSTLIENTLAEGEYKDGIDSEEDDLEIPAFLRRKKPEDKAKPEAKPEAKPDDEEDKPVSEHYLTKTQALTALNTIMDRGWIRAGTKQVSSTAKQYTFTQHRGSPARVRVERFAEGYRVSGADHILSEGISFRGILGGAKKMASDYWNGTPEELEQERADGFSSDRPDVRSKVRQNTHNRMARGTDSFGETTGGTFEGVDFQLADRPPNLKQNAVYRVASHGYDSSFEGDRLAFRGYEVQNSATGPMKYAKVQRLNAKNWPADSHVEYVDPRCLREVPSNER